MVLPVMASPLPRVLSLPLNPLRAAPCLPWGVVLIVVPVLLCPVRMPRLSVVRTLVKGWLLVSLVRHLVKSFPHPLILL